jgi:amino-acid N-acetyltransferase
MCAPGSAIPTSVADPGGAITCEPDTSATDVAKRFRAVRDELRRRIWTFARTNLDDGLSLGAPGDSDLAAIDALIRDSRLPTEVVRDQFPDAYVVARRGAEVVGVAALEIHDRSGLLRSVAVSPGERGRGTGIALVADRLATAYERGLAHMYLLTTTAASLFRRFGFADAERASAPPALAASPEFAALCPSSASCLRLDLQARSR